MDNGGDMLRLCRLCLVKDDVNIPIFEEQGDIKQIFQKISSCLPVKVSRDDKLPKKICDGCSFKLDMFYEFWNGTAAAEKQFLAWLGEVGISKLTESAITTVAQQIKSFETVVKQETIDPSDIHMEENDEKDYIFQQKFSEEEAGHSATATSNDEPPRKRARRTAAVKAQIAMDHESDEDDNSGEPLTKVEEESGEIEGEDHEPTFVDVPSTASTSADDQPDPSGGGKDGADALLIGSHQVMIGENTTLLFSCSVCSKLYPTLGILKRHISRQHTPRLILCHLCDRKFTQKSSLQNHVATAHSGKYFSCELCDKKCPTKSLLQLHVDTIHMNLRKYQCEKCSRKFPRKYQLEGHRRNVHGNASFSCDICDKVFKNETYLKSHIKRHGPNVKRHTGENKNVCDVCGKVITTKVRFREHMRLHTGEKPFNCEVCGKTFTVRRNLIDHRRVHTKEKPFICNICGKQFTQKGSLNVHTRCHTGERPYKCVVCSRKFITKTLMKDHNCKGPRTCKNNVC